MSTRTCPWIRRAVSAAVCNHQQSTAKVSSRMMSIYATNQPNMIHHVRPVVANKLNKYAFSSKPEEVPPQSETAAATEESTTPPEAEQDPEPLSREEELEAQIKDLKAYTWDDSEISLDLFKRFIYLNNGGSLTMVYQWILNPKFVDVGSSHRLNFSFL